MKKYCVYCGKENHEEEKKCTSCGKVLDAKDHLLKEYLKAHLLEEGSGKVLDTFKDVVQAFVKKYLYGLFLTVSVVTTTTSLVVHASVKNDQQASYQIVTEQPSIASLSGYVTAFSSYSKNRDGTYDDFVAFKEDGTFLRQKCSHTGNQVAQWYGTYQIEDNVDDGKHLVPKTIRFTVPGGRFPDDTLDIIDEQHLYYDPYNLSEVYELVFFDDPRDWYRVDISEINIREADSVSGLEEE